MEEGRGESGGGEGVEEGRGERGGSMIVKKKTGMQLVIHYKRESGHKLAYRTTAETLSFVASLVASAAERITAP